MIAIDMASIVRPVADSGLLSTQLKKQQQTMSDQGALPEAIHHLRRVAHTEVSDIRLRFLGPEV